MGFRKDKCLQDLKKFGDGVFTLGNLEANAVKGNIKLLEALTALVAKGYATFKEYDEFDDQAKGGDFDTGRSSDDEEVEKHYRKLDEQDEVFRGECREFVEFAEKEMDEQIDFDAFWQDFRSVVGNWKVAHDEIVQEGLPPFKSEPSSPEDFDFFSKETRLDFEKSKK